VAYDGIQYYRMFNCALTASSRGELDDAMLQKSAARLETRATGRKADVAANSVAGHPAPSQKASGLE
jgi:beta-N-acetylhexosaminidase